MATLTYPLPSTYPITRPFGDRSITLVNHLQIGPHTGSDFGAPAGTPVLAAGSGLVTRAGYVDAYGGRMVYLVHDAGGIETRYAHLSAVSVKAGQRVTAGQPIGTVGSSGAATGPHLHFEVIAHGAASCGLVAQGGLCFEDPAPYVGASAGATPAGVGSTSGTDAAGWAKWLDAYFGAGPFGGQTWRDAIAGYENKKLLSDRPEYLNIGATQQSWADLKAAVSALGLTSRVVNAADFPAVAARMRGPAPPGFTVFGIDPANPAASLLNLSLPPLLEPAISIGVLLAGAFLVWQGFREVLSG